MKRFVILSQQRSGTSFLARLLNSHPDIVCGGELFDPYQVDGLVNDPSDEAVFERDANPVAAVERFFEELQNTGCKAGGFKFQLKQNVQILHWIGQQPDLSIIMLKRDNKLAQVASVVKAEATQHWHDFVEDRPQLMLRGFAERLSEFLPMTRSPGPERAANKGHHPDLASDGKLMIGPRRISQRWHDFASYDYLITHWLKTCPNPIFRTNYREIILPETQAKICAFLGVNGTEPMNARLRKQGNNQVGARFVHQTQIETYFARRGLGHWLGSELDVKDPNDKP